MNVVLFFDPYFNFLSVKTETQAKRAQFNLVIMMGQILKELEV